MARTISWRPAVLAIPAALLLGALAGCGGPAAMSPQQKDAVELRRYCEQRPDDLSKCLGFLGDH
jgi:predicted small lipoprotein YifL